MQLSNFSKILQERCLFGDSVLQPTLWQSSRLLVACDPICNKPESQNLFCETLKHDNSFELLHNRCQNMRKFSTYHSVRQTTLTLVRNTATNATRLRMKEIPDEDSNRNLKGQKNAGTWGPSCVPPISPYLGKWAPHFHKLSYLISTCKIEIARGGIHYYAVSYISLLQFRNPRPWDLC